MENVYTRVEKCKKYKNRIVFTGIRSKNRKEEKAVWGRLSLRKRNRKCEEDGIKCVVMMELKEEKAGCECLYTNPIVSAYAPDYLRKEKR
jgi:hypothetical protein